MNLLSIDFDGVLHRASDKIQLNFRPNAAPWEMEMALKAQKRFVFAPLLANAIGQSNVSVVIHSTWRKRFSDATLKQFLPQEIAVKVLSLDGQIERRESMTSDEYLAQALEIIAPDSVCVVDDRPAFFESGHVQRWMSANDGQFVWCEPDVGLQDEVVIQKIQSWAGALHETHRHGEAQSSTERPS